jgi:HD-GYP domain-containing protein (c-di-GMP phosphodiesterase class II)
MPCDPQFRREVSMDRVPIKPSLASDIAAWAAVIASALAVTAIAVEGLYDSGGIQPYVMTSASACLVASTGFAVIRQLRSNRAARQRASAYEVAFASEVAARERLSFARHAASLMTSLPEGVGLRTVLEESLSRYGAEAAALVGDELTIVTAEGVERAAAQAEVLRVALRTVRAGRAVADELDEGSSTLTIPLRIRGQLKHVIVLWRRGGPFSADDLDGLSLVARIVELSMENRELLGDVRNRLSGTLQMMIDLVEQRLPEYGAYSERVAEYAVAVGRALGMPEDELEDLRTAGLLHDVGMLTVPETILTTPRRLEPAEMAVLRAHPEHGAELTRVAAFGPRVQEAILSHHERFDGTGYPSGTGGADIPVMSRILSVCDAYVALISDRPHRPRVSDAEAVATLRASAGTHYDADLVEAFVLAKAGVAADDARRQRGVL